MNSKTKNLLVIVGGAGAIIIGALLIYGILVTPARQPYREALTQYENVNRANDQLNAAGAGLNAGAATDEAFNKSIATAQAAVKSLQIENEALAKQEVLKDGEGKAAYDVFNKKLQAYIVYNDNVLVSMQKVRPVLFECNQNGSAIDENEASVVAIRDCAEKLGQQTDVPDADYKNLASTFKDQYLALANILAQIVALPDPKGADAAQYQALVDQLSQATDELSATSTAFTKSVQQHRNEVLPVNASKQLEGYLTGKSRIF